MQTEILNITGMTCGGCSSTVTRALVAVDGVHDVQVSLPKNEAPVQAIVQYDEIFTSPDKLKQAVETAGYGVSETNETANKGNCCG